MSFEPVPGGQQVNRHGLERFVRICHLPTRIRQLLARIANSVGICGFNILHVHYIVILPELNLNVEVYSWKKQGTIDAEFILKEIYT
jgi:hypothetical protein